MRSIRSGKFAERPKLSDGGHKGMKFTIDAIRRSLERMVRPINARYWRRAYEQEKKERLRIAESKWWYKHRVEMLAENQPRMRDPERTLVCDIIANGQLLPDTDGSRYGPNAESSHTAGRKE